MSYGQGAINFTSKPSAGGGGSVTGARSGTGLSGAFVELGINPLLQDTVIESGSFSLKLGKIGLLGPAIEINAAGNYIELGSNLGNNPQLYLDTANKVSGLGDFFGTGNGMGCQVNDNLRSVFLGANYGSIGNGFHLEVSDVIPRFRVVSGLGGSTNRYLDLNQATDIFAFGDLNATNNGLALSLNDATGRVIVGNTAANAAFIMNGVLGFTGTVAPVNSITVKGGIVTAVS